MLMNNVMQEIWKDGTYLHYGIWKAHSHAGEGIFHIQGPLHQNYMGSKVP